MLLAWPGQRQVTVLVWKIPDAVCAALSSWLWTEKPSEICRASYRYKWIEKRRVLLVVLCEYISDARTYRMLILNTSVSHVTLIHINVQVCMCARMLVRRYACVHICVRTGTLVSKKSSVQSHMYACVFFSHNICDLTSLVVWWSGSLTTNHEVPGSIPGSTMGIFPCRERFPCWPWSG